jgi:hypothetical protein
MASSGITQCEIAEDDQSDTCQCPDQTAVPALRQSKIEDHDARARRGMKDDEEQHRDAHRPRVGVHPVSWEEDHQDER